MVPTWCIKVKVKDSLQPEALHFFAPVVTISKGSVTKYYVFGNVQKCDIFAYL